MPLPKALKRRATVISDDEVEVPHAKMTNKSSGLTQEISSDLTILSSQDAVNEENVGNFDAPVIDLPDDLHSFGDCILGSSVNEGQYVVDGVSKIEAGSNVKLLEGVINLLLKDSDNQTCQCSAFGRQSDKISTVVLGDVIYLENFLFKTSIANRDTTVSAVIVVTPDTSVHLNVGLSQTSKEKLTQKMCTMDEVKSRGGRYAVLQYVGSRTNNNSTTANSIETHFFKTSDSRNIHLTTFDGSSNEYIQNKVYLISGCYLKKVEDRFRSDNVLYLLPSKCYQYSMTNIVIDVDAPIAEQKTLSEIVLAKIDSSAVVCVICLVPSTFNIQSGYTEVWVSDGSFDVESERPIKVLFRIEGCHTIKRGTIISGTSIFKKSDVVYLNSNIAWIEETPYMESHEFSKLLSKKISFKIVR